MDDLTQSIVPVQPPTCFSSHLITSHHYFYKSHFTPVFSPTISDNPIFFIEFFIKSPPNNTNNMVNFSTYKRYIKNSSLIIKDLFALIPHAIGPLSYISFIICLYPTTTPWSRIKCVNNN